MRAWSFSEAEADPDRIMDAALSGGQQRIVTRDGRVVIMVSEGEFQSAQASRKASASPIDRTARPSRPAPSQSE
ncbi:type II toxin-antitoxin system Phd/YefM family antitoxin [Salinarimonas soli]|uniref:Antitoxin n=1 Tax=Salinarimonas soli TaxID=1638099 RepID=A0A5B2VB04_9HYPH|nr:type II toxin-antitoxin system Phd/YefM family antitoxin [Salinarimonas soli]KAA2235956.1 type II toxin-antitoxin system Phd/YefM family antitoxin [Salinarimonas soli]